MFAACCVLLLITVTALNAEIDHQSNDASKIIYANAVDISTLMTQAAFTCYKSNNVQAAFIRVYMPTGAVDTNGPTNIQRATSANLGIEIYMQPQASSSRQCGQQLDDALNYLSASSVTVRSIWLQVTQPINWPNSPSANQNFIISCIQRAAQRNIGIGVFTNSYDWGQITSGWASWSQYNPNLKLWYWANNGNGPSGQTVANFNDFANFAGFTTPLVKQYAVGMSLCSTTVNYDVYQAGKAIDNMSDKKDSKTIYVGGFVA